MIGLSDKYEKARASDGEETRNGVEGKGGVF
jgi:hypothetical protein